MTERINGQLYHDLIDYGIRNLARYREHVNALNVFPVPDGDTGTNMIKTLQNGLDAMEGQPRELSVLSQCFARGVVFGARGNSGVILSQFFSGFSACLFERESADCDGLAEALTRGVRAAYESVQNPVEGTMLTVLREAAEEVARERASGKCDTVEALLDCFLQAAKKSLAATPECLPVLKSAGVVDSGGAGVVYVFSGMKKYLNREPLAAPMRESGTEQVDYSRFDRKSEFPFGYCTELLLQLTEGKAPFDGEAFARGLDALGDSLVFAAEGDKIKIHIHSATPERVLAFCHPYGEFLSLKIENMSVQHHELPRTVQVTQESTCEYFSVVAVAHDPAMERRFSELGADAVIPGDRREPPSAADFCEAFRKTGACHLLVFPNSKNAHVTALQAQKLYEEGEVEVFETVSDAQCYAALPMIDFEESNPQRVCEELREIVANVRTVSVSVAEKDTVYEGKSIRRGDLVAMGGSELLAVGTKMGSLAVDVICLVMSDAPGEIVTVFAGPDVSEDARQEILSFLHQAYPHVDSALLPTEDRFYPLVISFE